LNHSTENPVERPGSTATEDSERQDSAPELLASARYPVHSFFVGGDGLRPGWRILLFLAMAAAIGFVLTSVTSHWHPEGAGRLWQGWLMELELFLATVASAFFMSRIEDCPMGDYGLPARAAFGRKFWVGAIWGIVWLTALMLALRVSGAFHFGGLAIHGVRILKFAAFYGLAFLTVGFFEEFSVRGYVLFTLTRSVGFWPAAILLSIIFGGLHYSNQGEGWVGLLGAGFIGLFFCYTLRRTGSLWFAVGFHTAWDWGESYFYSVPDSGEISPGHLMNSSFHGPHWLTGGSIGPEGSVLLFVVIALLWVVFDRVYREAKYHQGDSVRARSETLQSAH
jgi:hypothetical protein